MPNTVSLIVVNYNAGAFLKSCIASSLSEADELIVVDNASTDASLAELEAAFMNEQKLRIIRNPVNLGFASACNIGVNHSAGNYVMFLNPDCILEQDSVERLFQALEDYPDAGMVGGMLVDPDGTEQGGGRRAIPTPWRSFVRAFGLSRFANRWPKLF